MTIRNLFRCLFVAATVTWGLAAAAQTPSVLKIALDGEIKILDPITTVNYRTRDLAYMVFDMLIAMDSKGNFKPQMLESFDVSPDRMKYKFTLRPGLEFSDGTEVTSDDCIASIKRWATPRRWKPSTKERSPLSSQSHLVTSSRQSGSRAATYL